MTNGTRNGGREFKGHPVTTRRESAVGVPSDTIQVTFNLEEFRRVLTLSEREYEVFLQFGKGMSTTEIAAVKGRRIKVKSATGQLWRLLDKLRVQNRFQLARLAVRYDASGLKRQAITNVEYYKFRLPSGLENTSNQGFPPHPELG